MRAPDLSHTAFLRRGDLGVRAAGHEAIKTPEGRTPGEATHPHADGGVPLLRYHTPLHIAIEGLKESIAGIEKKVAEGEHLIQKTAPDTFHLGDAGPDSTKNTNIDLSHLTDQLYRMLDRKIRAERERRGFNG
jgi:hypothetical protein